MFIKILCNSFWRRICAIYVAKLKINKKNKDITNDNIKIVNEAKNNSNHYLYTLIHKLIYHQVRPQFEKQILTHIQNVVNQYFYTKIFGVYYSN